MKKLASTTDPLWYQDAIIYELHVRAFYDSNGDGIGDFPGLLSKLDYLQELGITCIWLLPFFPSPLRDDGYDISNYVDVNPSYGTLSDFKAVLDAAHQRNMQVLIELVVNHTSDQHPWFKAARLAPAGSPQREMYVWSDTDQKYKEARIIFTDTEKSNWTWDEVARAYYWHRFFSHQPDLNYDNPIVVEEVLKVLRFWLDMGVDGLRMDAIPYLCERDGTNCENLPETHAAIKKIRAALDDEYANRMILAEANQWPADVRPYFGDGDECHMAFHFPLMPRIYMALRQEDRLPITDIMAQTPPIPPNCQWGLFLRNHDELTLEMVTDDERDYMYFAYSADPRMRVNVGIRRRLAPLVDNNRRRIELLNSILFSFPGTPITYYGDEIGMGDNIYLGDRNGVRTPMQWTSDRNAGFSRCDPARLYFPVIMDPIYGYQVVNVEAQQSDQSSLLHWTRNMIALRKLFQVFGRGTLTFLNPSNRKVLAYIRDLERSDGSHETVLCVANLSRFAQPVSLDLSLFSGMEPVEMLGYVPFPTISQGPYPLALAPYSFLWLELQPAIAEVDELFEPELKAVEETPAEHADVLDLLTKGWGGWFAGHGLTVLPSELVAWLPRQRWFGAKSRTIEAVRVLEWSELPSAVAANAAIAPPGALPAASSIPPILVFAEVVYSEGEPDAYQLALAFSTGADAEKIAADHPLSVVAHFTLPVGPAVLHEGSYREDTRDAFLRLIDRSATLSLSTPSTAALEIAASLAAAASGRTANQAIASGDAAELLLHPERATHAPATGTAVHLRPHEVFPEADPSLAEAAASADLPSRTPKTAAVTPPAPLPIDAQPGEAADQPRTSAPTSAATHRRQPGESPSAGNPVPVGGRLDARASSIFRAAKPASHLPSRVGSCEQSNTSILYGQHFILKLFRRLAPGENPDVEVGRFLTETAKFTRIPPFMGEIAITSVLGERTTTAMLQGWVANRGDGWSWFLDELAGFFQTVASSPLPPDPVKTGDPGGQLMPSELGKSAANSLQGAALLGLRTGELHLALRTRTLDPAFAAEPMTPEDLARETNRIEQELANACETLKDRFSALDDAAADAVIDFLSKRRDLVAQIRSLSGLPASGLRIRIHGDYHLGQTLRTGGSSANNGSEPGDFVLLDFEGEPARPLAERRRKQSPLKDVAGMLRSFSYAAHFGLDRFKHERPEMAHGLEAARMTRWANEWQKAACAEFLRSYGEAVAVDAQLLPQSELAEPLLRGYLLEKALYELLYELNNRPEWLHLPLAGILAL